MPIGSTPAPGIKELFFEWPGRGAHGRWGRCDYNVINISRMAPAYRLRNKFFATCHQFGDHYHDLYHDLNSTPRLTLSSLFEADENM